MGKPYKSKFNKESGDEMDYPLFATLCKTGGFRDFWQQNDYRVYFDNEGRGGLLKIGKGDVASRVQAGNVSAEFFGWYHRGPAMNGADPMGPAKFEQAVKAWSRYNNPQYNKGVLKDFPSNVKFKSDPGVTFTRLPYDPVMDATLEDCPIFAKMINRMGNKNAFVKKVGGYFDPEGFRKQSIWLWGPTNGGKSIVQQLITRMMGGASNRAILTPSEMKGSFWKELLVGKALWVVQEADAKFLSTPAYKSLTGDSEHVINPKGESLYAVKLDGHMLFASNEEPAVKRDAAVIDRVIPVYMEPVPEEELLEEHVLWRELERELPYIAGFCIQQYKMGGTKKIDCSKEDIYKAIEKVEEGMQVVFDTYFIHDSKAVGNDAEINSKTMLHAMDMRTDEVNGKFMRQFRAYLKGIGIEGIQRKKTVRWDKEGNDTQRVRSTWYDGIRYNDDTRKKLKRLNIHW